MLRVAFERNRIDGEPRVVCPKQVSLFGDQAIARSAVAQIHAVFIRTDLDRHITRCAVRARVIRRDDGGFGDRRTGRRRGERLPEPLRA